MPARNGTGPTGLGPMTGRGMGNCAGRRGGQFGGQNLAKGFRHNGGVGRGGYGRRSMFYATGLTGWQRAATGGDAATPLPAMNVDKQSLLAEIEAMQSQLAAMKMRLAEKGSSFPE